MNTLKKVYFPYEIWEDENGNTVEVNTYDGGGADVGTFTMCDDEHANTLYWNALKVLAETKSETYFEYGGKIFDIRFFDDGRIVLTGSGDDCNPDAYDDYENFLCEITAGDVMYLYKYN